MAPALKANDVLTIFFIRSPADVPLALSAPPDRLRSVGVAAAGPRFTHQIFPNEAIVGYAPGLAIRLLYTAGSMVSYLTVTGAADAVEEAADADGVPDGTPRRGGTDADEAIAPVARPRGVGGGGGGARGAKRIDASRPPNDGGGGDGEKTDILGLLAPHVAPSAVTSVEALTAAAAAPWSPPLPPSCVVAEYTLPPRPAASGATAVADSDGSGSDDTSGGGAASADHGGVYRVYKCRLNDHPDAVAYHKRIQAHAMLHIDGANYIDDADPRWEVFFTWWFPDGTATDGNDGGGGGRPGVELVAYATIYPFAVYEKAPPVAPTRGRVGRTSGVRGRRGGGGDADGGGGGGVGRFRDRLRISQVLVVPPHQRAGHGGHLLAAIYADAAARDATEVTVEDPSAGFRRLRDGTDLRRGVAAGLLPPPEGLSYDAQAIRAL